MNACRNLVEKSIFEDKLKTCLEGKVLFSFYSTQMVKEEEEYVIESETVNYGSIGVTKWDGVLKELNFRLVPKREKTLGYFGLFTGARVNKVRRSPMFPIKDEYGPKVGIYNAKQAYVQVEGVTNPQSNDEFVFKIIVCG